jgi:hypothetical protein
VGPAVRPHSLLDQPKGTMPVDTMGMGDEMGAGNPASVTPPPAEHENDSGTIFLSKEALGGRTVKEGETITLTVKSLDPETGDVEAKLDESNENGGMGGSSGDEFDKAMPPAAEGEGY